MVIIQMSGGLGNQMFQYALYTALKARGREVRMDDVTGFKDDAQRDPVLADAFDLKYDRAAPAEVTEYLDNSRNLFDRIRRRISGSRSKERAELWDGNFEEDILDADNVYLRGYWQSDRYFQDDVVRSRLNEDFSLNPSRVLKTPEAWDALNLIERTESVSIHIRRGDYLWPDFVGIYGDICTEEYYHSAVEYMLDRFPRAVFYIFSNEKDWTAEHFTGERFVTVGSGQQFSDTEDLLLMSRCRHHIIANSSFSWWAAWLNDEPEKLIIAPAKWINNRELKDIHTERMVKL